MNSAGTVGFGGSGKRQSGKRSDAGPLHSIATIDHCTTPGSVTSAPFPEVFRGRLSWRGAPPRDTVVSSHFESGLMVVSSPSPLSAVRCQARSAFQPFGSDQFNAKSVAVGGGNVFLTSTPGLTGGLIK